MARIEFVELPMADGIRLSATLYHPGGDPPWPALVEALPYRKDDLTASYDEEYHRFADDFGYLVCRVDVRGTGSSEGMPGGEYTAEELADVAETIGWLASQDWSNGNVGMYGTSWSGFNTLQVAMLRPPALKAICSIMASDDRYADDVHYFGGALKQLDLVDYPTYMEAMNVLPPVPGVYGDGWRDVWRERFERYEPWTITWLEHQTYDDFWKHGSLREDYASIEAATMLVTGWVDGYTNIGLRGFAALECPRRLVAGPWGHSYLETSLPGPNTDIVPEMVRWWDRWLKGADNGVDREPPIMVFVRRPTPPSAVLREYRGEWRFEPGWPLERSATSTLELAKADANRDGDGPDELAVRGDVGWTAWISCAGALPWGQPQDQRPDEAFSLVYDWEPLEEELEILGHPRVALRVSSSAPVAFVSAKLCDVHPDGASQLVTRGLLNLTHRTSREHPDPLEPGETFDVDVELEVTSWVFEAGHRIRLDIAGSDWPNVWAPPYASTFTLDRARSALELPVVDGPSPIERQPALPPPRSSQLVRSSAHGHELDELIWRIEHDVVERQTRAVAMYGGPVDATDNAPAFEQWYGGTVGVSLDDPGRAFVDAKATYVIRFPEATVRTESRLQIQSDANAYTVRLEIDAGEGDDVSWSRRWDRRIDRELQ